MPATRKYGSSRRRYSRRSRRGRRSSSFRKAVSRVVAKTLRPEVHRIVQIQRGSLTDTSTSFATIYQDTKGIIFCPLTTSNGGLYFQNATYPGLFKGNRIMVKYCRATVSVLSDSDTDANASNWENNVPSAYLQFSHGFLKSNAATVGIDVFNGNLTGVTGVFTGANVGSGVVSPFYSTGNYGTTTASALVQDTVSFCPRWIAASGLFKRMKTKLYRYPFNPGQIWSAGAESKWYRPGDCRVYTFNWKSFAMDFSLPGNVGQTNASNLLNPTAPPFLFIGTTRSGDTPAINFTVTWEIYFTDV